MIGIEITAENKADNNLRESVGSVMTRGKYPNVWQGTEKGMSGGYADRTDLHSQDGWGKVIEPTIGANQKRGAIYRITNSNDFTYYVIDKSDEEIQQEQISASESNKAALVQAIQEKQVTEAAQEFDDTDALDNKDLYPMFDPDGFEYTMGFKCQDFNADNELVLYKCIQPIVSQAQYPPRLIAAHFIEVAYPGQILPWVQPGGQNSYNIPDRVTHDRPQDGGNIWVFESKINANTTEPGRDGTFDRWWLPVELYNG